MFFLDNVYTSLYGYFRTAGMQPANDYLLIDKVDENMQIVFRRLPNVYRSPEEAVQSSMRRTIAKRNPIDDEAMLFGLIRGTFEPDIALKFRIDSYIEGLI